MTALARDAVFISHANPEDNAFTIWLGSSAALGLKGRTKIPIST